MHIFITHNRQHIMNARKREMSQRVEECKLFIVCKTIYKHVIKIFDTEIDYAFFIMSKATSRL